MLESLRYQLASTFAIYQKTLSFHWNIEGNEFFELHELFEQHYLALATEIDQVAEIIRTLGFKVEGGLDEFAKLSKIAPPKTGLDGKEMINVLINDYETLLKLIEKSSSELNEHEIGVRQQLALIYANHQKTIWMMKSWSRKS